MRLLRGRLKGRMIVVLLCGSGLKYLSAEVMGVNRHARVSGAAITNLAVQDFATLSRYEL